MNSKFLPQATALLIGFLVGVMGVLLYRAVYLPERILADGHGNRIELYSRKGAPWCEGRLAVQVNYFGRELRRGCIIDAAPETIDVVVYWNDSSTQQYSPLAFVRNKSL